jgi:hypothetical protein
MKMKTIGVLLVLAAGPAGCGLFTKSEDQPVQEPKTKGGPDRPEMTVGELDQLARNYSDRLVARVSTACDQIKRETRDEEARKRAHDLKLSVALAAYDIVTTPISGQVPGAAQHVLDLTILTELHAIRWIEEHAARDTFGERGAERLSEALSKAREDIWQIAGRVMDPPQIDQLRTMILHWRQQNPSVEWLARVRLDALGEAKEIAGFAQSVGQAFGPVKSALKAVDETRVLAQQALWYAKRAPTILDWTTEATLSDALAVPKVGTLVQGLTETMGAMTRATGSLQQLLEPSSQEPAINSTIEDARDALVQAKEFIQEVRGLQQALQPLLEKSGKKAPAGKPVDINHVADKADDVARGATSFVRETRALAESPSAMRNVDKVLDKTTQNLSDTGHDIINLATWRAVELILLVAVLVVVYKIVTYWIKKRRARAQTP